MAKILIVEDNPDNMKLFRAVLTIRGHQVVGLPGGETLLETMRAEAPAIVLLDMDMPEMDGFEVLEALRRTLSGRAVPVIVVTARDDPETESRCIELGAEDYITKPIQPATLIARIRAVLRRVGANAQWPVF